MFGEIAFGRGQFGKARCVPFAGRFGLIERTERAALGFDRFLQAAFVGSGYWMVRDGALREAVLARGADAPLYARFAPERLLVERMRNAPSPPAGAILVMGADPQALAELGARGRTTSWYSHRLSQRAAKANADASGAGWVALAREEGVTDIILRDAGLTAKQRKALALAGAYRVDAVAEAEWWRLP